MDDPTGEELEAQAEEYYADPDNLLDHYEREFIKHKDTEFEPVYAIKLIQTYIDVNRPFPLDLHPYVANACDAWLTAKRNARLVGKAATRQNLEFDVVSVDLNKALGKTKESMFEALNPDHPETLAREYRRYKKQGK